MKVAYFFIAMILVLVLSWAINGFKTPKLDDEAYLREYKVLHATKLSDKQILELRRLNDEETLKWKHSNRLLDEEMQKRGISAKSMQMALLQTRFFSAYYENNVCAEEFLKGGYE